MTEPFDPKPFLRTLTRRPGVYQMLDAEGKVLYVGKARDLRQRVSSYFQSRALPPKTRALVERIASVQVTVTDSETEALILEQNLIKQYRPPYNVLLRDDKSYPYLYLSEGEPFPRLALHRGAKRAPGRYFGPYPSAAAVRESLVFLQKTFRVRQCEDSVFRNRTRPCLQYQIRRCTAPCVGLVAEADYARDVEYTRLFLEGRSDRVLRDLERRMAEAAESLEFERAAALRDQLAALRELQRQQVVEARGGDVDVVGAALEGNDACVHFLYVRGGRVVGSRSYHQRLPLEEAPALFLTQFLSQYYLGQERDLPRELLCRVPDLEGSLIAAALQASRGRRLRVVARPRGVRARWCELAERAARENLEGRLAAARRGAERLEALARALGLEKPIGRLECFDISHSAGEEAMASCVVFDAEGPVKADYRRFAIAGVAPGDDYGALAQALRRRFRRLIAGEGKLPDLLLVDGGRGQVARARSVLAELGLAELPLLGVAKGPDRRPGWESFHLDRGGHCREVRLPSAAQLLVQQVRDEAHRFAVAGHRRRRDRKRRTSPLEAIPGVGPVRRRRLLGHFGGFAEVARASVADLMRVPGIDRKVAEAIYAALHGE
ncbi:MAG: UvrABC system protein C [Porticoccaceae bacterium]|nr:MAG: UvrABC system protein C [Porticoccaceae bacterium]